MTVFKTYLRILNRHKWIIFLMMGILALFGTLNYSQGTSENSYTSTVTDIYIENHDDSVISRGIEDYMGRVCHVKAVDIGNTTLDDALFYGDIQFIMTIPEQYGQDLLSGGDPQITVRWNDEPYGSLTEMLLERYVRAITLYSKVYDDPEQIVQKADQTMETSVKTTMEGQIVVQTTDLSRMNTYFNFENYPFIYGVIYVLGAILFSFKEQKVRRRTLVSPISERSYMTSLILSNSLLTLLLWGVFTVLAAVLFRSTFFTRQGLLYVVNSLVFMLCSLTMGFLILELIQSRNAMNALMNIIGLGSSFLCGAFVPQSFLPDSVLKAAHVLPSYWFVANNNRISSLTDFSAESLKPYFTSLLIMAAFGALFVVLTLAASRGHRQES